MTKTYTDEKIMGARVRIKADALKGHEYAEFLEHVTVTPGQIATVVDIPNCNSDIFGPFPGVEESNEDGDGNAWYTLDVGDAWIEMRIDVDFEVVSTRS